MIIIMKRRKVQVLEAAQVMLSMTRFISTVIRYNDYRQPSNIGLTILTSRIEIYGFEVFIEQEWKTRYPVANKYNRGTCIVGIQSRNKLIFYDESYT